MPLIFKKVHIEVYCDEKKTRNIYDKNIRGPVDVFFAKEPKDPLPKFAEFHPYDLSSYFVLKI